jgi:hypothetical protein
MTINFVTPTRRNPKGGTRLMAQVEVHFDDDSDTLLKGLKLVGFKLWRKQGGELYVTLPARAFSSGADRGYMDFVRSSREKYEDTDGIRQSIIDKWLKTQA